MMHPRDPDVGQFSALLNDLAEVQRRRAASAPVLRAIERHGFAPGGLAKALDMPADTARVATTAELTRTVAGLERLAKTNRELAQAQIGEKRARLRQQAADLLRRAMIAFGKGTMTAVEVAGVEGRVNRFLSALDQQQAPTPVRARIAA